MKITILRRAEKEIERLPKFVKIAVVKKIRELAGEKQNIQRVKIKGYDKFYRVRVGKYRIVYYRRKQTIEVVAVRHRRDIYRGKLE